MDDQKMYGIWTTWGKKWCFGICEPSKTKARKALFNKIGSDAYKWRFEVRRISPHLLESGKL